MVFVPADGGGSGDTISADTHALQATAPTFRQAGQQVNTLLQDVTNSVQMSSGDMFMLLEFAKMASMMEQLQERIAVAMQCAAGGLNRIGISLEIVSGLYIESEEIANNAFTHLKDDIAPWHIGLQLPPDVLNINPGRISPQPTPTPQPDPGIHPPQKPSVNPLPGINPGLEPDLP